MIKVNTLEEALTKDTEELDLAKEHDERLERSVKAYKNYAYSDNEVETEETLAEDVFNRVVQETSINPDELKEALLKEEQSVDTASVASIENNIEEENPELTDGQIEQAAEEVKDIADNTDTPLKAIYIESDIERSLNASYNKAIKAIRIFQKTGRIDKNLYQNICIVGDVGVGKTERVKAWANHMGVRLVSMKANSLTIDDIKAIPVGEDPDNPGRAKTVSFGTFDIFDKGDLCVLYLDEYNRADPSKRDAWFKFMDEHTMYDPMNKETGVKFFPNLLFTVATINPYIIDDEGDTDDEEGVTPLSKAEKNRFADYLHISSRDPGFNKYEKQYYLEYLAQDTADDPESAEENAGKAAIITKLLDNPNFLFDGTKEIRDAHAKDEQFLTPRSLTLLLTRCDGTKRDFLKKAETCVGMRAKRMMEIILSDYSDSNDITNAVWKFWEKQGVKVDHNDEDEEEAPVRPTLTRKETLRDKVLRASQ